MTASTSLGTIEYADSGTGPNLLLLHGAMGGFDQGMLLGRSAVGPNGFRFVAVSRPGYLGTPLRAGAAPERQADLCAALLDTLSIRQTAVIAISGGGQCALQFALRHPERCGALVMISACSAPLSVPLPLAFYLMKLVAHIPAAGAAMRRKVARDPDRAARRPIPDPALRASTLKHPEAGRLLQELQLSTLEQMAARMPGTENDIHQSRRPFVYSYERVGAPVLVIHGTGDEAVPFAHAEALASRVPNAELLAIEGGRHVSLFTHMDVIRPRVRSFLERSYECI
jgi:pimeloyl-ACP methyl ester carboxylesterase